MTSATRDRLVHTAMKLFWEKGYGSTSVADVLQAAGVNSGSLYHFFPGKQDLLLAVLDAYREGIGPMLLAPAWRVDDPIDKIFRCSPATGGHGRPTAYGCPIGSSPGVARTIRGARGVARDFDAWTAAISSCLDEAAARLPRLLDRRDSPIRADDDGRRRDAGAHQRDVAYFDRSVRQLRAYLDHLEREATLKPQPPKAAPRKRRTKHSATKKGAA
jgi:AcrR family transcriptional regulator